MADRSWRINNNVYVSRERKSCQGGYDVKVASQGTIPASYYCPHCKKLLKNTVQTSDGDRLCDVCFEEIAR